MSSAWAKEQKRRAEEMGPWFCDFCGTELSERWEACKRCNERCTNCGQRRAEHVTVHPNTVICPTGVFQS